MAVERNRLKLGIVPLIDCAPIVVAKERGFFAEAGLEVEISREPSWANIRDKLAVGALDGAQMLATMPLSMSLGLGAIRAPVLAVAGLNLGGNTIALSAGLAKRMEDHGGFDGPALKRVIDADQAAGVQPMAFAMVYPFSTHHYELRYWLAAAGIDPDRHIRLTVVPPPQMVGHLSAGNISGFCVGEPWGTLAAGMELGRVVASSDDIFANRIEKVLGVTRAFADANPETVTAMIKAVVAAARWCDDNPSELAEILSQPAYVNVPLDVARRSLEAPSRPIFHAHAANFPWRSQALWFLSQMQRWNQLGSGVDTRRVAEDVYRPDLYRLAALELGLPVPLVDHKTEGSHAGPWVLDKATAPIAMGADTFLDGARFDPLAAPKADAQALKETK
ncbi:CmpA/NrtA family ABC transporter substrate-binding protein [Magnetospirillum moscoviense]|uniref:Nitrate ABC transporter n=1 Tax=Magnetospirillum moscoviense TaxID=1437059 RepID=A0A178MMZ0_9PROT|nr:CmpA/NrtA family ABC transporter substrate-binding protein [Magnetospirillum moscoviense]MBF0325062.1 ABC transporter substrate-binding protein [Alphaproteobacteria bacterium]OAN50039.1 nitrate ABC transporter [Magnetospirillum moscoviense]